MGGYTKLFNSILASTIWRADDKTRLVWITLLAMADKFGNVEGSIPGLADFAHVSIQDCEAALAELHAPDRYSRSKEQDGRRIETVEGGWWLINHGKYRKKMSADDRREYQRVYQAKYRKEHKHPHKQSLTEINNVGDKLTESIHTEAEAAPKAAPQAKKIPQRDNKLTREVVAAVVRPSGSVNGRSRRPIFTGQRFVVFDWMLEDLGRALGSHRDAFDLHSWFFDLDAKAMKDGAYLDKSEQWPWLQRELTAEVQRRNLPIVTGPPNITHSKKTAGNLAALQKFAARGRE